MKKLFMQNLTYGVAILLVAWAVLAARSCAKDLADSYAPPENVTIIPGSTSESEPGGPLVIHDKIYDLECENNGEVINAIIYVEILGGVPPYQVDFDPGDLIIPDVHGSFVIFTLKGGKRLTIRAKSNTVDGEPMASHDVYAPSHHLSCEEQAFIDTQTLTLTPTPISTNISTPTKLFTLGSTATKDNNTLPTTPVPTTPVPTTPVPTTPVPTTPVPTTPVPTTPVPTTPVPTTPVPTTPVPTTPHPNQSECEDGIDNDNDGKIDLQDPQCKSSNDNHEDK